MVNCLTLLHSLHGFAIVHYLGTVVYVSQPMQEHGHQRDLPSDGQYDQPS